MSLSVNATLHELAGPDMPGKVPPAWGTLLLNLAGASASALFQSGAQFKNNAQGSRANENKGLDCAEYTCGMGSQDHGINDLLIRFTWNTSPKCVSGRCYSPVACAGFGYCRELNLSRSPFRRRRPSSRLSQTG
jgi:hypothetical protein